MGAPLTIVYVTGYGAHEWALHTPQFLARRGHRVMIACPSDSPMARLAHAAGMNVQTWQAPRRLKDVRRVVDAIGALYRLFRQHNPDVVVYYALPISLWARLAARLAGVPVRLFKPPSLWDLELGPYRLAEYGTAWMDSAILASSRALVRYYRRAPIARSAVILSYYGFPLDRFDPSLDGAAVRQEFGIAPTAPVVTTIAHLIPPIRRFDPHYGIKGHEVLIRAARDVVARLPSVRFLIVGAEPEGVAHGAYEASLKQLARMHGVDHNVIFTGRRTDIPAILAASDVAAVPSLSENVGGAVEPLLMERPVVASAVGGLPDVVRDGETGYLVPPRDPGALADALLHLLSLPPAARRAMGRRGRAIVRDLFDIEQVAFAEERIFYRLRSEPLCATSAS
ncbi:MAG: glycosyltransferase family 4 protein [Roseiflexus sp.]|nr:glycosyltransferase family 4 protein [Roseiflexus sp.]MCS7289453.1 glycosyltransferase family 4 protein [Roseiflexus sp.]MDW8234301.1 glycosyltransferase family 4 protein [Roseiflexaceae bacterium]